MLNNFILHQFHHAKILHNFHIYSHLSSFIVLINALECLQAPNGTMKSIRALYVYIQSGMYFFFVSINNINNFRGRIEDLKSGQLDDSMCDRSAIY